MQNPITFQVQYDDIQRQQARLNSDGWQYYPPTTRTRLRETLAKTLLSLAAQLAPANPVPQPRTA